MVKCEQHQLVDIKTLKNIPSWKWPRDAGNLVLNILRDPEANPADRLLAAGLAGDFTVINDELAGVLLEILKTATEPTNLRAKTALSLGPVLEYSCTFGPGADGCAISPVTADQIIELFHRLYKDKDVPKEIRRRILEVSVRAAQDWHPEAIRAAYLSGDEDYKLTAVFCMGFIPGFDHEIMEAMENENPAIRHEATRAAGNWQVGLDWLDIDSPLTSGEDNTSLLQSDIRATTGSRSFELDSPSELPGYSNNDQILDALEDVLSMGDLPWDDEFIETDEENDDFD